MPGDSFHAQEGPLSSPLSNSRQGDFGLAGSVNSFLPSISQTDEGPGEAP